jgi:glycosyltransferase involved in cell wall biosynthesis
MNESKSSALPEPLSGDSGWPWKIESGNILDIPADGRTWPRVTIITPSFNQARFLEATIRSVLLQRYPNLEFMVIDGGSTDGSQEIIRRYADHLAYWVSEKDRGQSHAINKGLARAQGTILGWINSDDVLKPGTISRIVDTFNQNIDIDVVYGRLERIDSLGKLVPTPLLPKDKVDFDKNTALLECVVNQPGCFWRKRIMDKVGLLNESLHYGIDYEYWTRMLLAGGKFKRLDYVIAEFRLSDSSKTISQTSQMAIECISIVNNFIFQPGIAQLLNHDAISLRRQANKGRGDFGLQAFYGCVKDKKWFESVRWLIRAHRYYPFILFNRKWVELAVSGVARRFTQSRVI